MKMTEGSLNYEIVNKDIRSNVAKIQATVDMVTKDVEDALSEFKKKIEQEMETFPSNDFNTLQMYEWYEKEGTAAAKKCLSHQRNIQMIRKVYKETVAQCLIRADVCVSKIREKIENLHKLVSKYETTNALATPCDQLDNQEECLSQALELAKQRTETMLAVLKRFDIFKKLKLYEIETNFYVCQSISEIYKESEGMETQTLRACMARAEDEKDEKKALKLERAPVNIAKVMASH